MRKFMLPPPEEIKNWISYDNDTGEFRWLKSFKSQNAGQVAGSPNNQGYMQLMFQGKLYKFHRLAWWWVNGDLPKKLIDHENGIKADNRILNLKLANESQNEFNRGIQSNNKTGVKGVTFKNGKYHARVGYHGKRYHAGCFDTIAEAKVAVESLRIELHGKYANHGK